MIEITVDGLLAQTIKLASTVAYKAFQIRELSNGEFGISGHYNAGGNDNFFIIKLIKINFGKYRK